MSCSIQRAVGFPRLQSAISLREVRGSRSPRSSDSTGRRSARVRPSPTPPPLIPVWPSPPPLSSPSSSPSASSRPHYSSPSPRRTPPLPLPQLRIVFSTNLDLHRGRRLLGVGAASALLLPLPYARDPHLAIRAGAYGRLVSPKPLLRSFPLDSAVGSQNLPVRFTNCWSLLGFPVGTCSEFYSRYCNPAVGYLPLISARSDGGVGGAEEEAATLAVR